MIVSRTRGAVSLPSASASAGTAAATPPSARAAVQRTSASGLFSAAMWDAAPPSVLLSVSSPVLGADAPRLMNGIGFHPIGDGGGDLIDRPHQFGSTAFHKFARHSPHHRG